jgi:hypothetical protein
MPAKHAAAQAPNPLLDRRRRHRGAARLHIGRRALDLVNAPATAGSPGSAPTHIELADSRAAAIAAAVHDLLGTLGKQPVEVRLASGWCRLLLLPWNAQLTNAQRWANYARARFEEKVGETSETWDLRIGADLPGRDRIAVAWPAGLRTALAALPSVRSVRVDLLEHMGDLLALRPSFSGCLAEIDKDGAAVLLIIKGRVRRIRTCRYEQPDELVSALRAEWATLDAAELDLSAESLELALATSQRDSAPALALAALTTELGFGKTILLPAWT